MSPSYTEAELSEGELHSSTKKNGLDGQRGEFCREETFGRQRGVSKAPDKSKHATSAKTKGREGLKGSLDTTVNRRGKGS